MTNLPIISNTPTPGNAASAAQTNGKPDAQPAESFGALLAQQMDEARVSALVAPSPAIAPSSTIIIDANITADSANPTGEGEQDKTLAVADVSGDPASALAAMLQLPPEIKTPVINPDNPLGRHSGHSINSGQADLRSGRNPAIKNNPQSGQNEPLMAGRNDAVFANGLSGIKTPVGRDAARGTSGLEIIQSAALAGNPAVTPLPAHNAAPSIASLATSAAMPNMPVNNTAQAINTPLGNSGWAGDFSQKIIWMSTQKNQVAELHLNPPDLGPLNVVLKISDNQATALFTSPHGAVRDAVENALPKLRELLADNGITLGNATVSDQSPRDRAAERFMSQDSGSSSGSESTGSSPTTTQIVPIRRHNGMVDIFA